MMAMWGAARPVRRKSSLCTSRPEPPPYSSDARPFRPARRPYLAALPTRVGKVLRMPVRKSSTSLGVDGPLRDEAASPAERAGMPVGQWLERALRKALDVETEPAPPEGVEIGELEAMVRRVVAEELRPVLEAFERLEARAAVSNPAG